MTEKFYFVVILAQGGVIVLLMLFIGFLIGQDRARRDALKEIEKWIKK